MVLNAVLKGHGVSATLRHWTNLVYDADYDEIDEASSTYSDTNTYILLKPYNRNETKEVAEGRLEGCDFRAYIPSYLTPNTKDLIIVGSRSFEILWVEDHKGFGEKLKILYLEERKGE